MPCRCRSAEGSSPLLALPAARAILELDADLRDRVVAFLREVRSTSLAESEGAWLKHKGPIATYRYAIAYHAALLARAVRRPGGARWKADQRPHLPTPRKTRLGERSNSAIVRNPLLALRSITPLQQAPEPGRSQLHHLARCIARDCAARAQDAWTRRVREDALFWRAASVYAGHLARALARAESSQLEMPMAA